MEKTIIFIHGMFQNDKSWQQWKTYFESKGYNCVVEPWPLHEGEPASLRANPPAGLGDLRLETVIDKYQALASQYNGEAIVIGHSVGGLIAQLLANRGLIKLGVAVSSVAPNRMLSFDWGFFKNSISITNPFMGDDPYLMDEEGFHGSFANSLPREASDEAFRRTATHDSRNVLRDCMLGPGDLDIDETTTPLLFIGGEVDQIVPAELVEKNAKAYGDGIASYIEFSNRSHFICGEPGWEEVASHVANWIESQQNSNI